MGGAMISPGTKSLVRPLTRGPTATTVTVKELIGKVLAGAVRIPRFQRPLRWRGADVVKLLDSISRGYPVGSLLFWKRDAPAEQIQVGGAKLSAPDTSDAWWVVDGQQRTTALAASLLDLDHAGDPRWVVSFDPSINSFRLGEPRPEEEGRVVPVSVLGDLRRLGRWIRTSPLEEDAIDLVEQVQARLLDYAMPAYVVDTDDEQALRGVFARLNNTGARMRADEVFQALLGAPDGAGASSLDLDALQNSCDLDGFGKPPRADILKALLAMAGRDPTVRLDDSEMDAAALPSRDEAQEALSRTREFLVSECGVPSYSLVPYPVVFVILSRWFYMHPERNSSTQRMLAHWFWRGAATGAHQRAEVSKMREQVRDIDADEQTSLDKLLSRVPGEPAPRWELKSFDSRSARSRIETLALLSCRPRDLLGEVSIGEVEGRLAREVFSSNDWDGLSESDKELARTAANRVILDDVHWGLHTHLREWDPKKDLDKLATHLIDGEAFGHLLRRDIGAFLRRRAEAVRGCVETFLRACCAWNEPQLRLLDAYVDGDED
jgi:Protein of unknown function DUF262